MITFDTEEQFATFVDEAMKEERLGEMWYNAGIERAVDAGTGDDVVEELRSIREEEDEHFETLLRIASDLEGGGTPPREEVTNEVEGSFDAWDDAPTLIEAIEEKREAEDQREELYSEIADALRRADLDLDTDDLAATFEDLADDEGGHRDTLDEILSREAM